MRDYKQMQEINRLREEAEQQQEDSEQEQTGREAENYSHRSPGFSGWLAYIREYYKWPILIGALVLIGVFAGITQMRTTSNPDLSLLYVGPYYLNEAERSKLEATVASLSGETKGDYNGDGEFRFDFLDLTVAYLTDADGKQYLYDDQNAAYTRLQTELRAGDALLYFLQPYYYRQAKADGILQPLDELGVDPSVSFDGYGIYIGDLDCYALGGLGRMPAETVVCLRRSPDKDALSYGRTVEGWEHHKDLFMQLLSYRDPEQTVTEVDDPDVVLLYVGAKPVLRSFRIPAQELMCSLDTSVKSASIRSFTRSGSNAQREVIAKQVRTELRTGDSYLWLLDADAFNYAKKEGLLAELPDRLATAENATDAYGVRLSSLPLYESGPFREMEGELFLCLRKSPSQDPEPYGRTEESYQIAQKIFDLLTEYRN